MTAACETTSAPRSVPGGGVGPLVLWLSDGWAAGVAGGGSSGGAWVSRSMNDRKAELKMRMNRCISPPMTASDGHSFLLWNHRCELIIFRPANRGIMSGWGLVNGVPLLPGLTGGDPALSPRGLPHHRKARLRLPRMRSSKTTCAGRPAMAEQTCNGSRCSERGWQ